VAWNECLGRVPDLANAAAFVHLGQAGNDIDEAPRLTLGVCVCAWCAWMPRVQEAPTFEDVCPDKMNSLTKSSFKSTSKLLGEGGFSKVKLGVHRESEKKVAIKITSDKDKNARNEVRLLSLLGTHDHLCHLLECYRSGKKLYMVFDYYAQGDLMDLLLEVERFQEPVARRVAVQMADAVNFCHAFNIAHRDIKGENVFYRGDVKENNLHIVLGDFGAATYFEKWSDVFSEKIGSSCYVAPELLKGYYYPSKADVWSFGATIFALMSGHPPFHGPYRDLTTERVLTIKLELPIAITKFSSKAAQNFIMVRLHVPSHQRAQPHRPRLSTRCCWLFPSVSTDDGDSSGTHPSRLWPLKVPARSI